MKPTTIHLPEDLKRWANLQALREDESLAGIIRKALERYREHAFDDDPLAKRIEAEFGPFKKRPITPSPSSAGGSKRKAPPRRSTSTRER